EVPLAHHQPLGLSAVHRVLREGPRHRRGRKPRARQRDRAQATGALNPSPARIRSAGESMSQSARFPAEWEPQSAILIAWPPSGTDWAARLGEVEETYIALVAAITRYQPVIACVADEDVEAYARARLASARVDMEQVRFVEIEYDDTWLRDTGPVTLRTGDGFRLLDFRFTGWGGKFGASRDDRLVEGLEARGLFRSAQRVHLDFALEGGAIETDGAGTLLTTWQCLAERHPGKDREALTRALADSLCQQRVLWL